MGRQGRAGGTMGQPTPSPIISMLRDLNNDTRKADKARKDSEAIIQEVNAAHKRLQDAKGPSNEQQASELRALYERAIDITEKEEQAAGSAAAKVQQILTRRASSAKRPHPTSHDDLEPPPAHPLPAGTEVAAKREDQWILAQVSKFDAGRKKYELLDADDEEGEESDARKFKIGQDSVLSLGFDGKELPRGSLALAVFPGTTTFYEAIVVAPPSQRHKAEYVLTFDEDEFRGMQDTPARRVGAKYVLAHPG
eukprot:TRINITY_DN12925_c0_g1_i1.p1 TRINITY_DN12925_c0_g1~~TRINITY_DN12925_c0_g1_i1.p1  ORF type:complete len:252 (-),score=63.36 TRINITY_DN12925_c0_g1_i1:211-966(-)